MKCYKNIPCGFGEVKQTTMMPMVIAMHVNIKTARIAITEVGIEKRKRFLNIQLDHV
jgi:hypothetical protein